jgi:hypothetical protein
MVLVAAVFASRPSQAAESRKSLEPALQLSAAEGKPLPRRAPPAETATRERQGSASTECAWIGKRLLNLLARDDAMAANDFMPFYLRFGCPETHIGRAFGCVVKSSDLGDNDVRAARVDACWEDPSRSPPKAEKSRPTEPAATPAKPQGQPGGN